MPKPVKLSELNLSKEYLASLMDFSVLNPDATQADIDRGIEISKQYNFKGFHTNTFWAPYVAEKLDGTGIEAGWPVAFPFGCVSTAVKVAEAREGATLLRGKPWVIDMVANHGKLKSGDYAFYKNDIAEVVKVAHDGGAECKAILEAQLLTDDELKAAVELASEAGVDWVKSSTGRHGGPQLKQVKIMCETAPEGVKVKIAGTGSFWTPMVTLGCLLLGVERIGTRNAPWICDELSGEIAALLK
jgi:deoxyribose-phosphate aldolase